MIVVDQKVDINLPANFKKCRPRQYNELISQVLVIIIKTGQVTWFLLVFKKKDVKISNDDKYTTPVHGQCQGRFKK